MANAFLLAPTPVLSITTYGTVQAGGGANLANDYAGVICQIACDNSSNACVFQIDIGSDVPIDTLMMFGLELFPSNGTFALDYATQAQGNFTGPYGTIQGGAPYAGAVPSVNATGVSLLLLSTPIVARYLLITYTAPSAGQSLRVSRLVFGKRIQPERNYSMGGSFGIRDLGSLDFSPRGVLLRRRAKKLRTLGLTFSNLRRDEVERQTKPLLERIGNTEMIAIVTDPTPHDYRMTRCYFGPLVGDLAQTQRNAVAWEAKANLVSIF